MKKQVLARSVAERMFSREAATLEKLIQTRTTSTHIIKHHFSELNKRWTTLQEKHDEFVIECVTDPSEITGNETLINAYSAEFIRIEAEYDAFVVSSTTEEPTERFPGQDLKGRVFICWKGPERTAGRPDIDSESTYS